jgi:hypothetical protein
MGKVRELASLMGTGRNTAPTSPRPPCGEMTLIVPNVIDVMLRTSKRDSVTPLIGLMLFLPGALCSLNWRSQRTRAFACAC